MMMKKCPSCGGENNDFNSFCEWCGGKLPESAEVKSEYVDGSNDSFNPNPNINSGMNTNYSSNYNSNTGRSNYYSAESDNAGIQALVFGILSIFCCSIIFGPLAIVKSNESDSTMAKAGRILGIIGLVLWVLGIILRVILR
ncbi:DUF4190 domain-containing protein [Acetivibrio thermocellus]|nr:hypothetical protein [Acetivibrio thermocellus]UWV47111.1 hypothetical protein N1236_00910 [Acetivibrio thermocellus]